MGVLTLVQIRTEVDSTMGDRTNITDPRLDVWINLAYNDIASGIDFDELDGVLNFATAVGTREYAGPVNPLTVQILRDQDNDNMMTWIPKSEYFRLDWSQTGTPARWTRRGTQLLVYPTPDAIVNLRALFKTTPAALVADPDLTVLPPYTDNAMIMLGAAYGLLAVNEDQRAIVWANRAIAYLGSRLTEQDFSGLLGGLAQTQPEGGIPVGT